MHVAEEIAEILYKQIVGDSDPDTPSDEYITEARMLVEILQKADADSVTADYIAVELSKIFTDMFNEEYPKQAFEHIAESVRDLYRRSK